MTAHTATRPRRSRRSELRRGPARRAAALVLGTAVLVSACSNTGRSGDDGSAGDAASGGTLTLGIQADKSSWDPAQLIDGGPTVLTWQPVFDTLLRYQPDGSIGPNAAEQFSFNEDFTVLTLTLREGMTFTDGAAVDAEAAKVSLEHYRDTPSPGAVRLADTEIEVLDGLTFTVTTPTPNPLMATYLSWSAGALASPASLASDDVATDPVASGPYIFDADESTSGTTLVYQRNEDYWNAEEYPYDEIVLRVMPDETARLNALQSGQINGAPISGPSAAQAEGAGLNLVEYQPNWSGLIIGDREGSMVPALGDVRVRQAINMVFDRDAIAEAIWQGRGAPGNQVFNRETNAFSEDLLDSYSYDIDSARRLMAEAGYADGFELSYPEVPGFSDQYTSLVVQQLGELGIRANVVTVPREQFVSRFLTAEFPLFAVTFPAGTPLGVLEGYVEPDAVWNVFHTEDPELSGFISEAYAQGQDAAEVFQEINQYVTQQAWFAPFGYPSSFWAFDDSASVQPILGTDPPFIHAFE